MSKDFLYGMYYIQYAFRDSSGYPMGDTIAPDAVADATTTHAVLLSNPVSHTAPTPTFETAVDQGGQKILAQKDMGVSGFGTGTIVLSEFDDLFHSHITGGVVDATQVSGWRQIGINVNKVTAPSFVIIVSTKAYDRVNATDKWSHWIYPNAQVKPTPPSASQSGGTNPSPLEYTIIPNTSTRTASGELFSGTLMNVEDNADLMYRTQTANPLGLTTYVENGTPANTFVTGYRPVTATVDDSDKVFTVNGAVVVATSHSITTGVVVTTSVVGSDIVVALYETIYTAI